MKSDWERGDKATGDLERENPLNDNRINIEYQLNLVYKSPLLFERGIWGRS